MKKYKNDNPEFSNEIDIVEVTDPNHADNINKADKQTFENTLVNKQGIEQLEKNKVDKINGKGLSTNDYTTAEKNKLSGIAEKANNYVHPASHPATMITQDTTHRFVSDSEKSIWNATLQSSKDYADGTYRQSTGYTDKKIADLINGAPETLDTLKEVADAIQDNKTVADALTAAVGKKANQTELDTHTNNNTVHITAQERTNWNDANSKKHSHSNKSVLDGITSALISTWNKVTDKLDKTGDASNTTTSFSTASTRTNIATGEKLAISLGKIAKFFTDLKTVAFTGSYTDLSNKPASLPANGGNSATTNGHTVNADVPAGAKFTDTNTTYNVATQSVNGLLSATDKKKLDGITTALINTWNKVTDKLDKIGGTISGDIFPDKTETYDLGHEDKKWDNVWVETLEAGYVNAKDGIQGNLTGNADTATKAVKDNAGDNIITSYRKRMGSVPNNDFNNATVEGVYTYGSSTGIANSYTNGGIGGIWGTLEVFNNGYNSTQGVAGTVIHQIAFTTNNQIYFRQRINAFNWTPWKELTARFSNFVKSGTGAKAGLVPAPSTTAGTTKYLREDGTWQVPPNTNTTYGAGTGIGLSDTTFYNTGVRGVATGSKNGTMAVNTNGTVVDVPVKGLGTLAYASGTWNKISGTNCILWYNEVAVYLEISAQNVNLTEYGSSATNKTIVVLPTNVTPTKGIYLGVIAALNSAWLPLNKLVLCNINYNTRNVTLRPTEALTNVVLNLTAMFPRSLFTIN